MRIDYQGRDHNIGLPHVHEYFWGMRGDSVVRIAPEKIYPYK